MASCTPSRNKYVYCYICVWANRRNTNVSPFVKGILANGRPWMIQIINIRAAIIHKIQPLFFTYKQVELSKKKCMKFFIYQFFFRPLWNLISDQLCYLHYVIASHALIILFKYLYDIGIQFLRVKKQLSNCIIS